MSRQIQNDIEENSPKKEHFLKTYRQCYPKNYSHQKKIFCIHIRVMHMRRTEKKY